jgi:hypothetical protein
MALETSPTLVVDTIYCCGASIRLGSGAQSFKTGSYCRVRLIAVGELDWPMNKATAFRIPVYFLAGSLCFII